MKRLSSTDQNSNTLTNIPTPVNPGDAANKAYTDTKVSTTTTVNGHALSSNVTVSASDVGAPSGSGTSTGTNTGDQNLSTYAPLASPTFTGVPVAPTAAAGTNTTQLATTAFDRAAITASYAATATLTNKAITPRVVTLATGTTITIVATATDVLTVTTLTTAATFAAPTGTLVDGQMITVRIKSAAAQALAWNAIFISSGIATLAVTTVAGKTITQGFIYNAAAAKLVLMAADNVGY